jgi:hypothetical protein
MMPQVGVVHIDGLIDACHGSLPERRYTCCFMLALRLGIVLGRALPSFLVLILSTWRGLCTAVVYPVQGALYDGESFMNG